MVALPALLALLALLAPLALLAHVGCSSSDFNIAAAADVTDDSSSSRDMDVMDAMDVMDPTDVTDAGEDAEDVGPMTDGSSCDVKNACGGCGMLVGDFGAACGECGKLTCSGDRSRLECDDPKKNACGGCVVLGGKPGDSCPSCGGMMKCDGPDKLTCNTSMPKNACGGCNTLAAMPGTPCGKCNTGSMRCMGTDAVACDDPEATKPALGTACGACGGGEYKCTMGAVKCADVSVTPSPGTACGLCGTSMFVCDSTSSTKCAKPDDRKVGSDLFAAPASPPTYKIAANFGGNYSTTKTNATLASVALFLRRRTKTVVCPTSGTCLEGCVGDCSSGTCTCKLDPAYFTDGNLDLEIRRDTPSGALVGSASLSTSTVTASGGWVKWTAAVSIAASTTYFLGVRSTAKPGVVIEAAEAPGGLTVFNMMGSTGIVAADIQLNACGF